jgi:hypothetical protein
LRLPPDAGLVNLRPLVIEGPRVDLLSKSRQGLGADLRMSVLTVEGSTIAERRTARKIRLAKWAVAMSGETMRILRPVRPRKRGVRPAQAASPDDRLMAAS